MQKLFLLTAFLILGSSCTKFFESQDEAIAQVEGCYFDSGVFIFSVKDREVLDSSGNELIGIEGQDYGKDTNSLYVAGELEFSKDTGLLSVTGPTGSVVGYSGNQENMIVEVFGTDGNWHRFRRDDCEH